MLAACILAHNAVRWLPDAIASVLGHVDRVHVSVDDRTDDGTLDWLASQAWLARAGLMYATYTFQDATVWDGFSGAYNHAMDVAGGDWSFLLDADETIDPGHAGALRGLVAQADAVGVDCLALARYNWYDLARTNLRAEWFPDYQSRLLKRGVRCIKRVHSQIHGAKVITRVDLKVAALHHFNLAYRDAEAWVPVNVLYDRLAAMDKADGH